MKLFTTKPHAKILVHKSKATEYHHRLVPATAIKSLAVSLLFAKTTVCRKLQQATVSEDSYTLETAERQSTPSSVLEKTNSS